MPKRPIPAGAGETPMTNPLPCKIGAYPRWRGGNALAELVKLAPQGLSPLARGKRLARCCYPDAVVVFPVRFLCKFCASARQFCAHR